MNSANTLLNYLYAILEAEARIELLSIGLDPGMGVLHADLKARASLPLDVMEPARPEVDRFVLELLRSHTFAVREYFETRQGVCRVLPPLTHHLAELTPRWTKATSPVAEAIAQALLRSRSESGDHIGKLPTLLTEANRSAGRESSKQKRPKAGTSRGLSLPRACQECGVVLGDSSRKYCNACFPDRRQTIVANFATAGPAALAKRRAVGTDPAHTKEAQYKQGLRAAINMRENAEWECLHTSQDLQLDFLQDIQPALQCLPLSKIMDATGLSLRYSSLTRRGLKIPHRRHWAKLAELVPDRAHLSLTKGQMTPLVEPTHVVTRDSRAVES